MPGDSVAVIGCGVIGLTTAIVAQDAGYRVTIYADRPPTETTSTKAAASFKPVDVAYTETTHRMLQLAWHDFARIGADAPQASGVRLHLHWDASSEPFDPPPYLEVMQDVRVEERPSIPGGYAFAYAYQTFLIDTTVFLPWLVRRFTAGGGQIAIRPTFESLDELARLSHGVVFNCTGLGARELCADPAVAPIKGQIVLLDPTPDMDWSIKADGFYVYPRAHDTVLGGTAEWNREDETVEHGAADAILRANRRILPYLKPEHVRRTYAGLRPYRHGSVRLELDSKFSTPIVHNYGHGGAGFTLCWGSARLAVDLIR